MNWTVARIIEATGGTLLQGRPDQSLAGISTDTRQIHPSDCFVALVGERTDGHEFLPEALTKGAGALVIARSRATPALIAPGETAVVAVPDTLYALGELARYWRRAHPIPVVAVTGSNGKTTSKEMVAAVLGESREILKTQANFNNLIGLPLTLLALEPRHRTAVVEMGINVPGEMARLLEIARPTVGLITNVQPAHLEGLISLDEIVREKGQLWLSLGPEDLAIVNLDDERLATLLPALPSRIVTYSMTQAKADVRVTGEVATLEGTCSFTIGLGNQSVAVSLPILGLHHVMNALSAAAVGWGMGLSPSTIAAGLATYRPVKMRMQRHRLADGRTLIDDTYNANPGSMLAALRTVAAASGGKPVVAVLGDMRELGPASSALHREVGHQLAELGVRQLITLGRMTRELADGAREAGLPASAHRHTESHDQIVAWLKDQPVEESWILVKGSRSMAMERVVEGMLSK